MADVVDGIGNDEVTGQSIAIQESILTDIGNGGGDGEGRQVRTAFECRVIDFLDRIGGAVVVHAVGEDKVAGGFGETRRPVIGY